MGSAAVVLFACRIPCLFVSGGVELVVADYDAAVAVADTDAGGRLIGPRSSSLPSDVAGCC